jgi:hypothetical protein
LDCLSQKEATRLVRESIPEDGTDATFWERREGENFVEHFFASIKRNDESLGAWRHFDPFRERESLFSIEYDRSDLRSGAANYIEKLKAIHCRELDWLVVDVLMYAEISAFALTLNPLQSLDATPRRWFLTLRFTWGLLKWLALAALILLAISFELPLLAWGMATIGLVWQGLKWRQKFRMNTMLRSMFVAYAAAASSSLSWTILWELLGKSRELGAYWDPEVYRLVELRLKNP